MKRFVLIDGNAIMHRAFHGLPPLTSPDGELVNAVYGFFSMFLKILTDIQPHYIAVCFDRPKPTFRKALYAGYQAKRPQMADGLGPQFAIVHGILEKAQVTIFEVDGYEADDLIGTLARQAVEEVDDRKSAVEDSNLKMENRSSIPLQSSTFKNQSSTFNHLSSGIEVIIVSGDRDLLQLVNHRVMMFAPVVGLTNTILYNEEMVEKKFGIKPSQIIDYKALVGDASDNYPGVAGIGPKTAAELLRKYGSFENLYQHLGELAPKLSERLATDAEQAALAKKLATILTDAPIHWEKAKCDMKEFHRENLGKSFEEMGFQSLVKRLAPSYAQASEEQAKGTQDAAGKKGKKKSSSDNGESKQLGLL